MPGQYPLDLTGTAISNRIVAQPYTIDQDHPRVFVPSGGPFYTMGLQIRNAETNQLLQPVLDYTALHLHERATIESSKEVCCYIYIKNTDINSITITRQVVGGEYENLYDQLLQFLQDNSQFDYNTVSWSRIVGKPDSFPAAAHPHLPNDWRGYTQVIALLDRIRVLLEQGDAPSLSAVYNYLEARALEIKAELAVMDGDDFNQATRLLDRIRTTMIIGAGNFEGDANGLFYSLRSSDATNRFVTNLENYEAQGTTIYVRDPLGTHEFDDTTRYGVVSAIENGNEAFHHFRKKHAFGFAAFTRSGTSRVSLRAKMSWQVTAKDGIKLLLDDGFDIDYGTSHSDNALILRPGQSVEVELIGSGGAGGGIFSTVGEANSAQYNTIRNPTLHDARLFVDGTLIGIAEGGRDGQNAVLSGGAFQNTPQGGMGGLAAGLSPEGTSATPISGVTIEYLASRDGTNGSDGGYFIDPVTLANNLPQALIGGYPYPSTIPSPGQNLYGYDNPTTARIAERPEQPNILYLGAGVGGSGKTPITYSGTPGRAIAATGGGGGYLKVRLSNTSNKAVLVEAYVPKPRFNVFPTTSDPAYVYYQPASGAVVVKKTGSTAVIESPTVGNGTFTSGVFEVRIPANTSKVFAIYGPGGGGGGSIENGVGVVTSEATSGTASTIEHLETNFMIANVSGGNNGTSGNYDAGGFVDGTPGGPAGLTIDPGPYDVDVISFQIGFFGLGYGGGAAKDFGYSAGGDGAPGRVSDGNGYGGGGGGGAKAVIRITASNDPLNLRITIGEKGIGAITTDGINGEDGAPGAIVIS